MTYRTKKKFISFVGEKVISFSVTFQFSAFANDMSNMIIHKGLIKYRANIKIILHISKINIPWLNGGIKTVINYSARYSLVQKMLAINQNLSRNIIFSPSRYVVFPLLQTMNEVSN